MAKKKIQFIRFDDLTPSQHDLVFEAEELLRKAGFSFYGQTLLAPRTRDWNLICEPEQKGIEVGTKLVE